MIVNTYCSVLDYYDVSLRTFVLAEPSSPVVIPARCGKVDLSSGADLLNFYQYQWCRIRETSDQSFRLAEVFMQARIFFVIMSHQVFCV